MQPLSETELLDRAVTRMTDEKKVCFHNTPMGIISHKVPVQVGLSSKISSQWRCSSLSNSTYMGVTLPWREHLCYMRGKICLCSLPIRLEGYPHAIWRPQLMSGKDVDCADKMWACQTAHDLQEFEYPP